MKSAQSVTHQNQPPLRNSKKWKILFEREPKCFQSLIVSADFWHRKMGCTELHLKGHTVSFLHLLPWTILEGMKRFRTAYLNKCFAHPVIEVSSSDSSKTAMEKKKEERKKKAAPQNQLQNTAFTPITKLKLESVPKQHTKETSNYCIADNL